MHSGEKSNRCNQCDFTCTDQSYLRAYENLVIFVTDNGRTATGSEGTLRGHRGPKKKSTTILEKLEYGEALE